MAGIGQLLSSTKADVYALQEVTLTSPLNYWVPMRSEISARLPGLDRVFLSDLVSSLLPPPARLEHGFATLSAVRIDRAYSVSLPLEKGHWLGFLRKQYALVVSRIPISGTNRQWVVVNLHLAAYDPMGSTRHEQLSAVLGFAAAAYAEGHFVILAGDWNLVLGVKAWPHDTRPQLLEWAHAFPQQDLPPNWRLAIDPELPTVRQLDRPYVEGHNFVTVIDGFLVSPNVGVETVRTLDQGFSFSDHQPVTATFIAIDPPPVAAPKR